MDGQGQGQGQSVLLHHQHLKNLFEEPCQQHHSPLCVQQLREHFLLRFFCFVPNVCHLINKYRNVWCCVRCLCPKVSSFMDHRLRHHRHCHRHQHQHHGIHYERTSGSYYESYNQQLPSRVVLISYVSTIAMNTCGGVLTTVFDSSVPTIRTIQVNLYYYNMVCCF